MAPTDDIKSHSHPTKGYPSGEHADVLPHKPTETGENIEKRARCTVNRDLLPLKMFYFFFYGAVGSVIPFITVFMKSLHLTAAETGVATGVSVLVAIFLRTAIGVAADKMAARKAFLLLCCIGFGFAFFFLWFVPARTIELSNDATHNASGQLDPDPPPNSWQGLQTTALPASSSWVCLAPDGSQVCRYPPSPDHASCQLVHQGHASPATLLQTIRGMAYADKSTQDLSKDLKNLEEKRSNMLGRSSPRQSTRLSKPQVDSIINSPFNMLPSGTPPCFILSQSAQASEKEDSASYAVIGHNVTSPSPLTIHEPITFGEKTDPSTLACLPNCVPVQRDVSLSKIDAGGSINVGYTEVTSRSNMASGQDVTELKREEGDNSAYRVDLTFMVAFLLVTTARSFYSSATSLADAVAYTTLGPTSLKWGRQRMWGTVGTALSVMAATNINDHLQGNSFAALFIVCLVLSVLATLVGGLWLHADKSPKRPSFRRDVAQLLSAGAVRLFLVKLVLYGIMCGTAQNFFLWFLVDLGSEQTTLGLCVVVHCMSSVVVLRFSSRVFKLVSRANVLRIVLGTYVIRFAAFSFLAHAWWALPLELLHGVTYSLMWAAASSTASRMAPPGTQASCQAIAGAAYWDLGRGLGNLLTGSLMQAMGGRWTFRAYAGACALLLPIFWLLDRVWPITGQQVLPVATGEEGSSLTSGEGKSLNGASDEAHRSSNTCDYNAHILQIPHDKEPQDDSYPKITGPKIEESDALEVIPKDSVDVNENYGTKKKQPDCIFYEKPDDTSEDPSTCLLQLESEVGGHGNGAGQDDSGNEGPEEGRSRGENGLNNKDKGSLPPLPESLEEWANSFLDDLDLQSNDKTEEEL